QTYGVPPELFESLAAEHNLAFDWEGYTRAMETHGEVSGKVQHTVLGAKGPIDSLKHALHSTEFLGYETTEAEAVVKGIVAGTPPEAHPCDSMQEVGRENPVRVVLDRTPFYGESGGQVGDTGRLVGEGFEFQVTDTQKDGQLVIHVGHLLQGVMREGAVVKAAVDPQRRDGIRRAHSATHILHHALQKHLGSHAQQQGSKVDDDWLRFDFTNLNPVPSEQLADISGDVAQHVLAADPIRWEVLPLAEARSQGAMMLFGEKYPDPVRMVSMGDFSKELCGGTHLTNTREVEAFEILGEEGVSAGTRRITALTGSRAVEHGEQIGKALQQAAEKAGCAPSALPDNVKSMLEQLRELRKVLASGGAPPVAEPGGMSTVIGEEKPGPGQAKLLLAEAAQLLSVAPLNVPERIAAIVEELQTLRERLQKLAQAGPVTADSLLESAVKLNEATVVIADVPTAAPNLMRQLIDQIRQKSGSSAVLLASSEGDDKVTLVAGVSKDLQDQGAHAGNWVKPVAQVLGGGGGGRADMAQAGGRQPAKLSEALQVAHQTIKNMLQA
ncbi:MAG: alanine--tRNA ligase-related protein, partial [Pirellulales bacterium]|nr:alanine--tRNA ligase-related protein [Pirellulales bacterium]